MSNFTDWRVGHEEQWPVELSTDPPIVPDYRRPAAWVDVRDGVKLRITVGDAHGAVHFPNPEHERRARAWLRETPRPFLQRAEFSEVDSGVVRGNLVFQRTALRGVIRGDLVLRSESNAESGFRAADILLSGNREKFVLASVPSAGSILGTDDPEVSIYADARGGVRLVCAIDGRPGSEFLRIMRIEARFDHRARACRLVTLEGELRIDPPASDERGASLDDLRGAGLRNLQYWLRYEQHFIAQARTREDRMRQAPLEFDSVEPASGTRASFDLRIVRGDVLAWGANADAPFDSLVPVQLSAEVVTAKSGEPPVAAVVEAFVNRSGVGWYARVQFELGDATPPTQGTLQARSDPRAEAQARKRRQALESLLAGDFAAPGLLEWIEDPRSAPLPRRPVDPGAPADRLQDEAVRGALNSPGIFVIQGPPGTGKTTVIKRIVHELARRKVSDEGEHRRARILVTSIQNDAVHNMVQRLEKSEKDSVVVHDRAFDAGEEGLRADGVSAFTDRVTLAARDRPEVAAELARVGLLHDALHQVTFMRDAIAVDRVTPDVLSELRDATAGPAWSVAVGPVGAIQRLLDDAIEVSHTDVTAASGALALLSDVPDVGALDALLQTIPPSGGDTPLVEEWRSLLLAGRQELDKRTFPSRRLVAIWGDLLAMSRDAAAPAASSAGLLPEILAGIDARAAEAYADVRRELDAAARTDGVVIDRWLQRIAAPQVVDGVFRRHGVVSARTCNRAAPDRRALAADDREKVWYDWVIVDEAGRAGFDLLIPLVLGRRIVLVGDDLQLPPYVDSEVERQLETGLPADVRRESLFAALRRELPRELVVPLRLQRRMHESIGRLVSELFYAPEGTALEHWYAGARAPEWLPKYGIEANRPLVWLDTHAACRSRESRLRRTFPCARENPLEADLIHRLLASADWAALKESKTPTAPQPVGVLTFYRDQVALLRERRSRLPPEAQDLVHVGTVDSAQGREFPVVVLSCVRSNDTGSVGFLAKMQHRITVALSRAQRQLIIVGDSRTVARRGGGCPWLKQAYEHIRDLYDCVTEVVE